MRRSIWSFNIPLDIWTFAGWFVQIPSRGPKLCSKSLPECRIWLFLFCVKGETGTVAFLLTYSSESTARESELFALDIPILKIERVFRLADVTAAIQISHPNQARFKFPPSEIRNTVKCLWVSRFGGGRGLLKLRIDRRILFSNPNLRDNLASNLFLSCQNSLLLKRKWVALPAAHYWYHCSPVSRPAWPCSWKNPSPQGIYKNLHWPCTNRKNIKRCYLVNDTGFPQKKDPSAPNRSRTYDLLISSAHALPLCYRSLVTGLAV